MIDHETEKLEALPHEMGCWETFAEESIEKGISQSGEYDEMLPNGQLLITRFHQEMVEGTAPCNCQAPLYREMEAEGLMA